MSRYTTGLSSYVFLLELGSHAGIKLLCFCTVVWAQTLGACRVLLVTCYDAHSVAAMFSSSPYSLPTQLLPAPPLARCASCYKTPIAINLLPNSGFLSLSIQFAPRKFVAKWSPHDTGTPHTSPLPLQFQTSLRKLRSSGAIPSRRCSWWSLASLTLSAHLYFGCPFLIAGLADKAGSFRSRPWTVSALYSELSAICD
ncbi:hypothetical protein BT63DRAFT_130345 [Microthyrium microscopicum]|uniref:Uncharacterized protein n=1 Tax=Microthyrium microscopicum TaxID=703497 RepID=A0A6A6UM78_9PEZI|nr:hypothetical protein BT63DRAFT_130345 [Microthyrium microscopicum]